MNCNHWFVIFYSTKDYIALYKYDIIINLNVEKLLSKGKGGSLLIEKIYHNDDDDDDEEELSF